MPNIEIGESKTSRFLFSSTAMSWVWLVLRVYVGWEWLMAGWGKAHNPVWVGEKAGVAITGFLNGALSKTAGAHPDVSGWYAWFIKTCALPNAEFFSYLVTYGEILVGIALILGAFTGIAAFFGSFMNMNYLFAGTVSVNPFLLFFGHGEIITESSFVFCEYDKCLRGRSGFHERHTHIFSMIPAMNVCFEMFFHGCKIYGAT
jgi:thiosulfate dehydrogenase [quinone] large subunit